MVGKLEKRLGLLMYILVVFMLTAVVNVAYATEDAINLTEFPKQLAETLNIIEFAGGVLATLILMSLFLLPAMILARKNYMLHLTFVLSVMCFAIAVGWLPVWLLLLTVMVVAALWSGKVRDWISGGRS